MLLVFWLSALTIVYVYAGYPALLVVWARLRGKPLPQSPDGTRRCPTISIVIAAAALKPSLALGAR